jgi:hypothetical protein
MGSISFLNATDYDNEPTTSWTEDGFEVLKTVNGILKIMSYTNADQYINKGNYKITYTDPMSFGKTIISAVLNVTQETTNSPMIIKFVIPKQHGGRRYAYVKVNQGVDSTHPLGDFELTTYRLQPNIQISQWESSTEPERLKLVISTNTSGQSTIKMDKYVIVDGNGINEWINMVVNDKYFSSGYGQLKSFFDTNTKTIAFDNNYVVDRNSSGTNGTLYNRSQFDNVNYEYTLFNTDKSNIDLGANNISPFSFETISGEWGYIGSNYEHNTTNSIEWSGIYYMDNDNNIDINDTINGYKISAIDKTNDFIMLQTNDHNQTVANWEGIDLFSNGEIYLKAGNKFYPPWTNDQPSDDNLTTGSIITINANNYKLKATISVNNMKVIGSKSNYKNLSDLISSQSRAINVLELKVAPNSSYTLSNPNLDYNNTNMELVKSWYDALDNSNAIDLKVLDGNNL